MLFAEAHILCFRSQICPLGADPTIPITGSMFLTLIKRTAHRVWHSDLDANVATYQTCLFPEQNSFCLDSLPYCLGMDWVRIGLPTYLSRQDGAEAARIVRRRDVDLSV